MRLAQEHNAVSPVRLVSATPRSRVKHSITVPLPLPYDSLTFDFKGIAQANHALKSINHWWFTDFGKIMKRIFDKILAFSNQNAISK